MLKHLMKNLMATGIAALMAFTASTQQKIEGLFYYDNISVLIEI